MEVKHQVSGFSDKQTYVPKEHFYVQTWDLILTFSDTAVSSDSVCSNWIVCQRQKAIWHCPYAWPSEIWGKETYTGTRESWDLPVFTLGEK